MQDNVPLRHDLILHYSIMLTASAGFQTTRFLEKLCSPFHRQVSILELVWGRHRSVNLFFLCAIGWMEAPRGCEGIGGEAEGEGTGILPGEEEVDHPASEGSATGSIKSSCKIVNPPKPSSPSTFLHLLPSTPYLPMNQQ